VLECEERPGESRRYVGGYGVSADADDGPLYMRARCRDPGLGVFVSRDPIGLRGGLNLYGYVNNNPENYSDSFGLCPRLSKGSGLVIVGGLIIAVTAAWPPVLFPSLALPGIVSISLMAIGFSLVVIGGAVEYYDTMRENRRAENDILGNGGGRGQRHEISK